MVYNSCGCELDICVFTEDKGFIRIISKGEIGDVNGLNKSDVDIKGLRFANGLMWYGGNYEIGGLIQRDEEYIELVKTDAPTFFRNNEIENGNIALLCAVDVGDYKTFVAAVAYMGAGVFYYSSKIYNIAQIWKNSDIILPNANSFKKDGIVIDLTKRDDESEFYDITNTRLFSKEENARYDLYKQVKTDLKVLGIEVNSGIIDVYSDISGTIWTYNHDTKQVSNNNNKSYEFSLETDLSNIFSNHFHLYWSPTTSNCFSSMCELLYNGNSRLAIPRKGAYLYFTGNTSDGYYALCIASEKKWLLEKGWTKYSYTLLLDEGKKFSFNTPDNNLVEYENFIVPVLPSDTLNYQEQDINAILGDSKIITYTKD